MKLNDRVKTKPGIKTMGGWSGEGIIENIINDPKEPDNPIVIISAGIKSFLFNANELQKI